MTMMGGPKKPYKFTKKKKEEYLEFLAQGYRRGAAAEAVGITRWTPWALIRDNAEFAAAVDAAEMAACDEVEDALREAALSGNVIACQVWLYNRAPERWADKRRTETEHSGAVRAEVKVSGHHLDESPEHEAGVLEEAIKTGVFDAELQRLIEVAKLESGAESMGNDTADQ